MNSVSTENAPSDPLTKPIRQSPYQGLGRIMAFFGLILLLAIVLDLMISAGLRRIKTSSFGAFNQVMSGQVNADIIITGSSRALAHYDPRIIASATGKSVFNLGRNGSQTDMQLAYLKAYLKHNFNPKIVIHNLDLFSFVTTEEVYDPAQYFPYLSDEEIYKPLREIDPNAWKWKYMPLYRYSVDDMRFTWIKGLKGFIGINPPQDHALGFNPRNVSWTEDFSLYKAQNPDGVSFDVEPAGIHALEELIHICHKQGIQVILVYSPEFHEMQSMERNRNDIMGIFLQISEKYKVQFWDYSDSALSKRQELFQNSQHLNADGAGAFSRDLAERIKSFNPSHPD